MCLVMGAVLSRSQLYPLGFGAKPQQGRVEAYELRKVLGSLLDK